MPIWPSIQNLGAYQEGKDQKDHCRPLVIFTWTRADGSGFRAPAKENNNIPVKRDPHHFNLTKP